MKVLVVCSGNAKNFDFQKHQAFIYDQVEAVKKADPGISFDYYFISRKGIKGYLLSLKELKKKFELNNYHCIHAHFSLSALLANLQRKVPVISTFHGSDINNNINRIFSLFVEILSKKTIYVTRGLLNKAFFNVKRKNAIITCGVDFDLFKPLSKSASRQTMGLSIQKKYILFSSGFDNTIKNYPLAKAALERIGDSNIELLELKNYTRKEVAVLFNVVDLALMTSFSEGSPQFVKEAIACNCPIVSTDVGDVRKVIGNIKGCFITTFQIEDVADKIQKALNFGKRTNGREKIQHLDSRVIAEKIITVYKNI